MAYVHFDADEVVLEVPDGARMQDAIAEAEASILFGCREGNCATCMVQVLSGMENLSPVSEPETYTLTDEERASGIRLACQLRIMRGSVRLRAAEEL